jgi:arginyl-tRNA synthetase
MSEVVKKSLAAAIAYFADLDESDVLKALGAPKNRDFGDLAFPCFLLAKAWKQSPGDCAAKLASELRLPGGISDANPVGPYVNYRFDVGSLTSQVLDPILGVDEQATGAWWTQENPEKVIVEYSSPNIAKPFHVGHLRATLIGNALDRVFRRLGHNTISINHLGDWGTQFGFVWAGCELWGRPKEESVEALVDVYRRATDLKAAQENEAVAPEDASFQDINEMARKFFIDLENDEPYAVEFWKWCSSISLDYLKRTYQRLDIEFDHYTGESFYRDMLEDVSQELRDSNLLVESQGALGVDLGDELGFARILTPDGRSLYLTRDLATAEYRAETYDFDRCVYVVGAPQSLHFKQIKGVLKALGHDYSDSIDHVAFGHVMGMKTRGKGDFIELNSFIDEAENKALEAYSEQVTKRPEGLDENDVAKAVARAAIIFGTLSRSRLKDVQFKWEHALAFQGDTGPYVLYAYARINGIKEKALSNNLSPATSVDGALLPEDSARQLVSLLGEFRSAVDRAAAEYEPAVLCAYALDVAKLFSKAYLELQVVGAEKEVAEARLALFEAVRVVLGRTLRLLGISPIARM